MTAASSTLRAAEVGVLGLHPLNLWPEHGTVALLGCLYVFGVYAFMVGVHGRRSGVLLAFAATVPCFLFFSYAPFVSHDVLSGLALLAMVVLAARFLDSSRWADWWWLVVLGAAASLLKHTWAVCWVLVLIGAAATRPRARDWLWLAGGAAMSAMICWVALEASLGSAFPDEPFALRPLAQVRFGLGAGADVDVPAWIYLRNAFAFGPLAAVLLLPGIVLAWRSGRRVERTAAVVTALGWVVLHAMELREVRYAFVLLPLMALVAVRPLDWLVGSRLGAAVVALAIVASWLPLHGLSALSEAARVRSPFYLESEVVTFFAPLEEAGGLRAPVLTQGGMLSTTTDDRSPLVADVYHRIFHFGVHHLKILYGYRGEDVVVLAPPGLTGLREWDAGAAIVGIRGVLINPIRDDSPRQTLYLADQARCTDETRLAAHPSGTILSGGCAEAARGGVHRFADIGGEAFGPLQEAGRDGLLVPGARLDRADDVTLRFFR